MGKLLDRFRKVGGGFLNNVDGVIADYRFTTSPEFGGAATERKGGGKLELPLYVALTVQVDGAEAPETTHLFAGEGAGADISEDGHVIDLREGGSIWNSSAFMGFYASLVTNGLEDQDDDPTEPTSFEHILGVRARFVQVKDEAAMERAAKRSAQSKGKINSLGQKKGKDGKYYDQRTLQVSAVYSTGNTVEPPAAPAKGRGRKAAAPAVTDVSEFAQDTLVEILEAEKTGSLSKSKLNLAVTRRLVKDDRREDVRKYLFNDDNLNSLAEEGVITYEDGTITLA